MLHVYAARFAVGLSDREYQRLFALVSSEKREKAARCRREEDAKRSLVGAALASYAVDKDFGAGDMPWGRNEHGKPYVVGRPEVHFNISHAGAHVVCAVSDRPVGIDTESITTPKLNIARRFFCPGEVAYIQQAADGAAAFAWVWTRKESYMKMRGGGMSIPFDSFSVLTDDPAGGFFFTEIFQTEAAVCHVCTDRAQEILCHEVTLEFLMNR